jgi:hypothetical protein
MTGFTGNLVDANRDVWAAMADHPFSCSRWPKALSPTAPLQAWVQQDR